MTRNDIYTAFRAIGCRVTPLLLDANYDPVDLPFVQAVWAKALATLPSYLQVGVNRGDGQMQLQPLYIQPVWNCNKMSRWLWMFMCLDFAEAVATTKQPRNAPAFGPLSYLIGGDVNSGHDIDWFIDYSSVIHFFEKQTGEEVTLSTIEINSIFNVEAA